MNDAHQLFRTDALYIQIRFIKVTAHTLVNDGTWSYLGNGRHNADY